MDIPDLIGFYFDQLMNNLLANNYANVSFTQNCCMAINNLEFISSGIDSVLEKIDKNAASDEIRKTINFNIVVLIHIVAQKLAKNFCSLIEEKQGDITEYLSESEVTFKKYLNEEWSLQIRDSFWDSLTDLLSCLMTQSLPKRKPAEFYARLRDSIAELLLSFGTSKDFSNNQKLDEIQDQLKLHSTSSSELIIQFYNELISFQESFGECPILTIVKSFEENTLNIEVLNARKLPALSNLNPYVKVHLLHPEKVFQKCEKFKSKVARDTSFPLYDELFQV